MRWKTLKKRAGFIYAFFEKELHFFGKKQSVKSHTPEELEPHTPEEIEPLLDKSNENLALHTEKKLENSAAERKSQAKNRTYRQ